MVVEVVVVAVSLVAVVDAGGYSLGGEVMYELTFWMPGLIGEVAMGTKNESTVGFVIAV